MFPWRCDNFSFDLSLHCHLATASANHISPISLCICIFIMFLNYQKSTGNDISETVKTNTFRTLIEMRSLNRNVRPPFQETPDQPLLSPEDIMIMTSSVPQNNILPRAPQNLSAALHTTTCIIQEYP